MKNGVIAAGTLAMFAFGMGEPSVAMPWPFTEQLGSEVLETRDDVSSLGGAVSTSDVWRSVGDSGEIGSGASGAGGEIEASGKQLSDKAAEPRNAIGVGYGIFGSGFWFPVQPQDGISEWEYDACNAFFFCSEDGLFGGQISVDYVRRLIDSGRHALDLDVSLGLGWQSPVVERSESLNRDFVVDYRNGDQRMFALFSLMPTYRFDAFDWLSLGLGGGISYAAGGVPSVVQDRDVNVASKIEIAFRPLADRSVEATLSLMHRCAFFGVLNESGESSGSNWYSFGLRKWF